MKPFIGIIEYISDEFSIVSYVRYDAIIVQRIVFNSNKKIQFSKKAFG